MTERYRTPGVTRRWQRYRTYARKTDARRAIERFRGRYFSRLTKTNKGWTISLKKK